MDFLMRNWHWKYCIILKHISDVFDWCYGVLAEFRQLEFLKSFWRNSEVFKGFAKLSILMIFLHFQACFRISRIFQNFGNIFKDQRVFQEFWGISQAFSENIQAFVVHFQGFWWSLGNSWSIFQNFWAILRNLRDFREKKNKDFLTKISVLLKKFQDFSTF